MPGMAPKPKQIPRIKKGGRCESNCPNVASEAQHIIVSIPKVND